MEDGRGSSGIGSGKSIGLAEGILLPAEAVESNRSRPKFQFVVHFKSAVTFFHGNGNELLGVKGPPTN